MSKISTGRSGEELAADFLRKRGFKIVERNYKCHFGEVDIIAREADTLVFVEVKTRSSREFGTPAEAVVKRKLDHIKNVASFYRIGKDNLPLGDRIDVVAIELSAGRSPQIELIENVTGWIWEYFLLKFASLFKASKFLGL